MSQVTARAKRGTRPAVSCVCFNPIHASAPCIWPPLLSQTPFIRFEVVFEQILVLVLVPHFEIIRARPLGFALDLRPTVQDFVHLGNSKSWVLCESRPASAVGSRRDVPTTFGGRRNASRRVPVRGSRGGNNARDNSRMSVFPRQSGRAPAAGLHNQEILGISRINCQPHDVVLGNKF
jgi:hypothetical protein